MKKFIISSLTFGALALAGGSATAADVFLCAGPINQTMNSDGVTVPMWGFAQVANAAAQVAGCSAGATVPGPELSNVDDATGLSIHLYNDGIADGVSVIIPGQTDTTMTPVIFATGDYTGRVQSFTAITANGTTGIYTWNSLKPGTYAYQSGTHQSVQIQMGLYGALIKDAVPAGAGLAEAYPGVSYQSSVTLFYSEIDADLHNAVAAGTYGPASNPTNTMTSTVNYSPNYFLLNGEDIPSGSIVTAPAGAATVVRIINMGLKTHMPMFMGTHLRVIAEDGNQYTYPKDQYAVTMPAGKTKDAILAPILGGTYTVFDRRSFLVYSQSTSPGGVGLLSVSATPEPHGTLTQVLEVPTLVSIDTDQDSVIDTIDNCQLVSNLDQFDADSDGFGNLCDADFDNDGVVTSADYFAFMLAFGSSGSELNNIYDLDNDNIVTVADYFLFLGMFGSQPGPGATIVTQ